MSRPVIRGRSLVTPWWPHVVRPPATAGSPPRPDVRCGPVSAGAGDQGGVEERQHVVEALRQRVALERITIEQAAEERSVGEVAEQRAVAGDEQLLGILAAERAGVHLAAEVGDGE